MSEWTEKTVDEIFQEFWVSILYDETGKLNLEQLKKELYDYSMLMNFVPKVYMEITGGRISKPNTFPSVVIAEFNDHVNRVVEEAIQEYKDDTQNQVSEKPKEV